MSLPFTGKLGNMAVGRKLIGAFVIIATFSGLVGAISIQQIIGLQSEINNIGNKYWPVADNAMEMETVIQAQVSRVHEYMLNETEAKPEFWELKQDVHLNLNSIGQIIGNDSSLLVAATSAYEDFIETVNGTKTTKGVFQYTEDHWAAEKLVSALFDEYVLVHESIIADLYTIEENADVETGNWNVSVADYAMDMNIECWEVIFHINNYIRNAEVSDKTEGNLHLSAIQADLDDFEASIDGAGSSIAAGTDTVFDSMRAKIETGANGHDSLVDIAAHASTGIFAIRDQETVADGLAVAVMADLDDVTDDLVTALGALAAFGDTQVDDAMDKANEVVLSAITMVLLVILGAIAAGSVVGFFFSRSITNPLDKIVDITNLAATGDLSFGMENIDQDRKDEIGQLGLSFGTMMDNLRGLIQSAQETAMKVASTSQQLASTSQQVNASSQQISATIQQIARGSSQQTDMSVRAIEDVSGMSDSVDQALRDIEGTSKVIQDIAAQTNMLALNAAIEAARAGEYGRGFGVVADNVRTLAESSRNSALEIGNITNDIVGSVGGSVNKIQDSVQSISSVAEQFSASSEEVSAAVEQQAASMQEMAASAQELSRLAEDLSSIVAQFKLQETDHGGILQARDKKDPNFRDDENGQDLENEIKEFEQAKEKD